jgi:hypothetical protein
MKLQEFSQSDDLPLTLSTGTVIDLLRRSLMNNDDGIFIGSPVGPMFSHASFTEIVLDSYEILPEAFCTHEGTHVFITSILDSKYTAYSSAALPGGMNITLGIITHAVCQNQTTCVMFSSETGWFTVNGECNHALSGRAGTMELKYNPAKSRIVFGDSEADRPVFKASLPPGSCSFFIVVPAGARIPYRAALAPATKCFQRTPEVKQIGSPRVLIRNIKYQMNHRETPQPEAVSDIRKYATMSATPDVVSRPCQ